MRVIRFTIINAIIALLFVVSPALSQNVITSNLQERLEGAKSGDQIRINIRLDEQYNSAQLTEKTAGVMSKKQRRAIVVDELKSFSKDSQKELLSFLSNQEKNLQVTDIMPLWIVNLINCYATPEVIAQLNQMPGIARIDYDMMRQVIESEMPTAPLDKLGDKKAIAWNVTHIGAPAVWEEGFIGEDVVVAVLDTGVNANHLDLAGRMWEHPDYPNHGYNFVDNNNTTNDVHSHGTHCAGTVAGNGTAGTSTGMAPGATIMALKVLGDSGSGTEAGVWAAIQFSVDFGADVMSLSLGWQHSWSPDRSSWRIAMENAMNAGVVAAVAAGNEGGWGGDAPPANVRTPGDCPAPWTHPDQEATGGNSAVVTVGSTTNTDAISDFSSKGPVTWQNIAPFNDYAYNPGTGLIVPDVVAPGSDILSTSNSNNTGYTVKSGTSMAAPAVAGLMALMISKNPNLTPEEISQILEESALPLSTGKSNTFGSGRIDAVATIAATPYDGIRYVSHLVNDNQGNNDGHINPGETIQLSLTLENPSEEFISDVSITLSSVSEFVTVTEATADLGDFEAGETKDFTDIFTFEASEVIEGNYEIAFTLIANSPDNTELTWRSTFAETAFAQQLVFADIEIDDSETGNNNGLLDPGETANIIVGIRNAGQLSSDDITLMLESESQWLTLHQTESVELSALDPDELIETAFSVTAFFNTPLETLEELLITATSGLYEYEVFQDIIIGEAPLYSAGDIPSTYNTTPNTESMAVEPGIMSVMIPEGATITGVNVEYQITSTGGAWVSEQRSILRCVTEGGESETALTAGPDDSSGGTVDYSRTDLLIANNIEGGGEIEFELHVFRTWGGSGSNTQYAYVPNNTWKIIVNYELPGFEATFKVSNQYDELLENALIEVSSVVKQTDESGEAVFPVPAGTHTFSVSADRHRTLEAQSFTISDEDEIIMVELARVFWATFLLKDVFGNSVNNADIIVEDEAISGMQALDLDNGTYNFLVEAEGYESYEGTFEILDDDVLVSLTLTPVYTVTFNIYDQWDREVDHGVITIGDETHQTGEYEIEDLLIGSYDFVISAQSFFDYSGTLEIVDNHLVMDVVLTADGTSVNELTTEELNIFPNPATNRVNIEFVAKQNYQYTVVLINQTGQILKRFPQTTQTGNVNVELDLSDVDAGIYFIRIDNGEEAVNHKLVVQ